MKPNSRPAAALLRLLAAISAVQVSFGADSSYCQIGDSLSPSSCQEPVVVNITAQLNNAEQQISSLNVNSIYYEIAEAQRRIEKTVARADNLKTQGIYLNRSYQAYVTLAETLASQVGRQDCYLNYSRPAPGDIYSKACARITSAVRSYLNNLNAIRDDLVRLKGMLSENPPEAQLPLLYSCFSIEATGPRSVSDCFQSYVYDYKVFVRNITAQVVTNRNLVLAAEQSPHYAALRNNIDDSMALAAFDVKQYAEEVLYCAGFSARALYENSIKEIDTFISLYNDIVRIRQNVIHEINYADGNFTIDVESTIRNYLSPIFRAVEFASLYTTPETYAQLKTYIENAESLIQSVMLNVSAELISTRDKLVTTNVTLENIERTLRQAIDLALNGVNSCLPKCIDYYINKVNELKNCFAQSLNAARSILPNVKSQFSAVATQFQPDSNSSNILRLIADNYVYLYNYGETTATEIFNSLNLSMDSLSNQIVTSLTNEYANKVNQMMNITQPVKQQLQNYTEATVNGLDSSITTALNPIQNAINIIQTAIPGINITTLNATYSQLYEDVKQNLTNYINNIYLNFTTNIDFQTRFNLTCQLNDLQAKLDLCILQNVNTTISLSVLENVTKCFEPYVKNFTALLNSTLGSIGTIVDGIYTLQNVAVNSISNYMSSALQNATIVAAGIANSSLSLLNVTTGTLEQSTVNQLISFKQAEIDPLLNYVTHQVNVVKTSNFTSLANLTALVDASVQPWLYAISMCNTSNPSVVANLSSQYALINQLINNTLNSIYGTLTRYKQDAVVIEGALTNFTASMNTSLSYYNSTTLAARCSSYNASQLQYLECINNVTAEAKSFITGTLSPDLKNIANKTSNLTNVADANLTATIAIQLNNSYTIAKTEGSKILSMCNVTEETIQQKSLEALKSYNITPIYIYAGRVRSSADTILQRSAEMLNLGNYMIATTMSPMNDAKGSASYVTNWRYTFANETNVALSIIDQARRRCLSAFPNVTQDAYDLYATAVNINSTLDYQVSLLMPAQLNARCGTNITDLYSYHVCLSTSVKNFSDYYGNALKAAFNASGVAYNLVVNDTAKLNAWKDTVVTAEVTTLSDAIKQVAEKLLTDYNCTVDKLLGYALYIITQRYVQYQPNITSIASAIYASASNVLQTNHSSVVDIGPLVTQALQPLDQFIALVQNSTNQTVLTQDVLDAPATFAANASFAFELFLLNITNQALIIQNVSNAFVENVDIAYRGLNYTTIYNTCYNPINQYPIVEMVGCYNRLHYAFYEFLSKMLAQAQAFYAQITNLDVNIVAVITNYAKALMAQFKTDVCAYTAKLYTVSIYPVPQDLQPCLSVTVNRCVVEVTIDGKSQCIIFS